jgi:hypothetical protein
MLILKSNEYESEALKEIKEFTKKKETISYKDCIEAEYKIDDLYLKALKAKVACASILK